MSFEDDPLELATSGKNSRKANKTGDLKSAAKAKAKRITGGAPEVMVKITSFGKGAKAVKAHLDYISRNGELELETNTGELLEDRAQIKEFFSAWQEEFGNGGNYKNRRDTMHMVLSMPPGTEKEAVRDGARNFAKEAFGKNHEYVFALHDDQNHPHVHITVKMLGFDGKRLHIGKEDPQKFREIFAQAMREQGVDAEATPRVVRGVMKKADKQPIIHMNKRGASKVEANRVKEAAEAILALKANKKVDEPAVMKKVRDAHKSAKQAWETAMESLKKGNVEERKLAEQIRRFVANFPKTMTTRREELEAKLVAQFSKRQEKERPVERAKQRDKDQER